VAKTKRIKRHSYGQGIAALTQDAQLLPTAYNLAVQAVGNTDQWWTRQGSTPPAPQISTVDTLSYDHPGGASSAQAVYGTGQIQFRNGYLDNLNRLLMNRRTPRKAKLQLLAQLWGLSAHEVGHNLNYQHTETGIMNPDIPVLPGAAYEWAASVLPKRARRNGG
jgi:hypothetical protein